MHHSRITAAITTLPKRTFVHPAKQFNMHKIKQQGLQQYFEEFMRRRHANEFGYINMPQSNFGLMT